MKNKLIIFSLIFISNLIAEVGTVTNIKGEAYILRNHLNYAVKKGFKIEEKDVIATGVSSKLQIIFKDKTVITLGKTSIFEVKKYFFDKENKKGIAEFQARSGLFKAVTGQIGKINRDKFKLKTKTATIGIRGTHFSGIVTKNYEEIYCLKGAITVQSFGKQLEVLQGEMVDLKNGLLPQVPKKFKHSPKHISKNLKLKMNDSFQVAIKSFSESKFAREDLINHLINETMDIEDENVFNVAYQLVEAEEDKALYDTYINSAQLSFVNLETPDTDDSFESKDNSKVIWTLFLENTPNDFSLDSLQEAKPVAVVKIGNLTDFNRVGETMGGYDTESNLNDFWNGNSFKKEVIYYQGEFLGLDKTGSLYENPNLIDSSTTKVNFMFDMGNRYFISNFVFDQENENSILNFSTYANSDYTLSKYGFEASENHIFNTDILTVFLERAFFYGTDLNQISGTLDLYGDLENSEETTYYTGVFIANKIDQTEVYQKKQDENENFSWGYWAYKNLDEVLNKEIETIRGAWIIPKNELTPSDKINEYILQKVTANYSGNVVGTVDYTQTGETYEMENGNFNFEFDFANKTYSGDINFETADSDIWNAEIDKTSSDTGNLDENGFSFYADSISTSETSTEKINDGYGNGKFYGENADLIGGGFQLTSDDGKIAIGAFQGTKQ